MAIKKGYPWHKFFFTTCGVILSGMIGSRIYGILSNLELYRDLPSLKYLLMNWETGSAGAYLGGALGFMVISKYNKLDTWKVLDIYAPVLAFSLFIGRIGCFLSGCCYGKISSVPWAVSFPPSSVVYQRQRIDGLISSYAEYSLPVHPTQLYESLFGLILFLFLLSKSKKTHDNGVLMLIFLTAYSSFRFLIEFLRADNLPVIGPFSLPQLLYFMIFVLCLVFYYLKMPHYNGTSK